MKKMLISVKNAEYQVIESLKLNRAKRNKLNEVFVEGTESIKQAINAGLDMTRIIIYDEKRLSNWARLVIAQSRARVIEMTFELYQALCDREDPSEMLITAKITPLRLADLTLPESPFILIFDRPTLGRSSALPTRSTWTPSLWSVTALMSTIPR